MKSEDIKYLKAARDLTRQISAESCIIYNQLCAKKSENIAYNILDGQLKMASKMAKLESDLKG
ncbi:MAG: hypothetical protein ACI4JW_03025 [Oscillospiraceae bacterium]